MSWRSSADLPYPTQHQPGTDPCADAPLVKRFLALAKVRRDHATLSIAILRVYLCCEADRAGARAAGAQQTNDRRRDLLSN